MQEPLLTWNLFWTTLFVPLCLTLFGLWINRKLQERDKREEENHQLRLELEERKEEMTKQWRTNHTEILCRVKTKVDGIYEYLERKVDKDDCDRLMALKQNGG